MLPKDKLLCCCPHCSKRMTAPVLSAGKNAKCKQCGKTFLIEPVNSQLASTESVHVPNTQTAIARRFDLNHFLGEFGTYPLAKLIESYGAIEGRLFESLLDDAVSILKNVDFHPVGELFRHGQDGRLFQVAKDYVTQERSLVIAIREIDTSEDTIVTTRDVNHIGLIRSIRVVAPKQMMLVANEIAEGLAGHLDAAYTALQACFLGHAEEFHSTSLRFMNQIFAAHLSKSGFDALANDFWFVVFEKDAGYYSFDADTLENALQHYRKNQDAVISPFEFTIWMATHQLPFGESLSAAALNEGKTLQQSFATAKFIESAQRFWRANKRLIGNDYAVSPVAQSGNYSVTMAYAAEYRTTFEPVIEMATPALERAFQDNIKNCSLWVKTVKGFRSRVSNLAVSDLITDLIAKYAAEMTKGM
ncbi:hypothetical protein Poly51_59750 [Rubripirellula tenax]|uniref:Uncharacterized protein n=1 Tax=Rubripirellula tenax TaxID=2528015 RepID=A0A5C6EB35_9BACT|nr:hypothetical protein [Rubripirellula tenax]TWU44706.1 hypothetical protein Poly51_59750 [Rubripirellula tenax]